MPSFTITVLISGAIILALMSAGVTCYLIYRHWKGKAEDKKLSLDPDQPKVLE